MYLFSKVQLFYNSRRSIRYILNHTKEKAMQEMEMSQRSFNKQYNEPNNCSLHTLMGSLMGVNNTASMHAQPIL